MSIDLEIGGVEKSLINMLNSFDYEKYEVDLFLMNHSGELINMIPNEVNLLPEIKEYTYFRKSIKKVILSRSFNIALSRIYSKLKADFKVENDSSYIQQQYMWNYSLPFLPKINGSYDVAISYLWPHDIILEKVSAHKKIGWIHTDYSTISTDIKLDFSNWAKLSNIISISNSVTQAFLKKYPDLKNKIVEIENITNPNLVRKWANESISEFETTNENFFKIVSVGRLSNEKGFDLAIKALKLLHDDGFKNIKWYIVGYGNEKNRLEELIYKNELDESFILLGKKLNPYPFMKVADIYIQPSRYEGKAVTVTEAKILGKPIIITNYATAQSQIINNLDGYIVSMDERALAEKILELFENEKSRVEVSNYCKENDYTNHQELNKLYQIFNAGDL